MITITTKNSFDLCFRTQTTFKLTYLSAGCIMSKVDWSHRKQILNCYELILVFKGRLHLQTRNAKYSLGENELLLLSPYSSFKGFRAEKEETSFYYCRFTTDDPAKFGITKAYMHLTDSSKVKDIFAQLAVLSVSLDYPSYLPDLLVGLLLTEIGMEEKKETIKGCQVAADIAGFIQEKSGQVTTQQIADRFGYNKDYVSTLFKKSYGLTIKKYCNKIKLQNAKTLLISSSYSVKQIASMLGFNDDNQFIKFFNYHEKVSPTKFRDSYIR